MNVRGLSLIICRNEGYIDWFVVHGVWCWHCAGCFVLVISISCLMHAVLSIGKCYDHRFGLESLCISSDIKIMPVADLVKEVSDCNLHSILRVIGVGIKMLHQVTV